MTTYVSGGNPWRILLVEDTPADAEDIRKRVGGWKSAGRLIEVEPCGDFEVAKEWLKTRRYDLIILDLIDDRKDGWAIGKTPIPAGDEPALAGNKLLESVRQSRALPIIFYTAHPERLDLKPSVIGKTVTKGDWAGLSKAVDDIILTGIPGLLQRIEDVQRSYLWDFIETNTDKIGSNPMEAAILLARRLAFLLRQQTLMEAGITNPELVHPVEYYIYPRNEGDPQVGDIYRTRQESADPSYFLLLTPSCDMVSGRIKCEKILLAPCIPLVKRSAYKDWKKNPDQILRSGDTTTTTDILSFWLRGRLPQEDRTFFLPPAFDIPALIADFQHCEAIEFRNLGSSYVRLATLDSPFAEAAAARFARYFGRLGTSDLDISETLRRLSAVPSTPATDPARGT